MHNNTKITTFSVKKGHTYITTRKQQQLVKRTATHTQQHENNNIQCEERSHMQTNTKTTTIGVKKGHTCKTALKQQHIV